MENTSIPNKTCFITRDVMVEKTEKALNIWIEDQVPLGSIIMCEKANYFINIIQVHQKEQIAKFENRCNLNNVKLVG